ncbi:hypothetical protein acsn021_37280 [Anaerocolumna cellulosilytica]|uniref:Uncharacterized protein n=1 Tax=Anaerocolumna cellulosilytica TaxID=433286 RepID=A0A6S6R483_9FIRM|nr:hypothetical protein [Anaerocolumna cellulosilytica]MBB5195004.1 hypothetical protein [Anaerocolumna cellulosilytica]BCJ96159.1 hypothetical protein acsn021_37280 [Anaerocolumna cellulosilytica]
MGLLKRLFTGTTRQKYSAMPFGGEETVAGEQFSMEENPVAENSKVKDDLVKGERVPSRGAVDKQASTVMEHCEQIIESTNRLEELKFEYQAVTSYLTDMQKVELIQKSDREFINDLARKIVTITRERSRYQSENKNISESQFKYLAKFEDDLPGEMRRLKDNEAYANSIKNDMQYLEGEKGALFFRQEETEKKQAYLKGIGTTTSAMVIILFVIFAVVGNHFKANLEVPFILTIMMALVSAAYIFIKARENQKDKKVTDLKLNRAIQLLNKVKIKYINNTNALDYAYQKYMINSYAELAYLWEQYEKVKEEERKFNNSTGQLEFYNRELVKELKNHSLTDPNIWVHQVVALLDNKEMVEVRHRLNIRRQKLRDQIDYNNEIKEKSIEEVNKFLNQKPEQKEGIVKQLESYGIYL